MIYVHHLWIMYIAFHTPGVTDIFSRIKTCSNKPVLTCDIVLFYTYICCFMCTVCITHLIAVITLVLVVVLIGCELTHSQCPQDLTDH